MNKQSLIITAATCLVAFAFSVPAEAGRGGGFHSRPYDPKPSNHRPYEPSPSAHGAYVPKPSGRDVYVPKPSGRDVYVPQPSARDVYVPKPSSNVGARPEGSTCRFRYNCGSPTYEPRPHADVRPHKNESGWVYNSSTHRWAYKGAPEHGWTRDRGEGRWVYR